MRHMSLLIAAMALAASQAIAKEGRIGLGVNLGRADVRYELQNNAAVDGFAGLTTASGGGTSDSAFTIGGYYMKRLSKPEPVSFLWVAGLSIDNGSISSTVTVPFVGPVTSKLATTTFTIFGGVGAEYFLPGTKQFSIEGRVGLGIDFISTKTTAGTTSTSASSNGFGLKDLTGGVFMLRYYFE